MTGVHIINVQTPAQLERAFTIRRQVFVVGQGVSEEVEIDGLDDQALHLLAINEEGPVGTMRMRLLDAGVDARAIVKMERVAVLAAYRGQGIGRELMLAALGWARQSSAGLVKLHAQTQVRDFYDKLGFVAYGDEFMEDNIPHIAMRMQLKPD